MQSVQNYCILEHITLEYFYVYIKQEVQKSGQNSDSSARTLGSPALFAGVNTAGRINGEPEHICPGYDSGALQEHSYVHYYVH